MKEFDTCIVNPEIETYLKELSPVEDPIIQEMETLAEQLDFPIIGSLVGKFLYQITKISKAKQIFELGSGFGYSAYWFSKALENKGYIVCTEQSENNYKIALNFLKKSEYVNNIKFEVGDGLAILKQQKEKFDIIFNDIDKEYYPDVIVIAAKKLSTGGLLITDNMLWFGRVLSNDKTPSTIGVKKFTEIILSRKDFITTIIPIRDGISISLKI